MLSAQSLLVRTAGTIALALLLLVFISLGTAAYFVAIPVARLPMVLLLVIAVGILVTLFASFVVVRRITLPLERLYSAVCDVGQGHWPAPLTEDGAEELATLARAFNTMSSEVQALLENRTVLVAGISHDLRTPLTRLGLAVEMLGEDSDPQLIADIRRDLADMEKLIRQFTELAQGLGSEHCEELDLCELLNTLATNLERQGNDVQLTGDGPCRFRGNPLALRRILVNLLDNAAHYGEGKPIDVELQCDIGPISIRICDRGPGIPEEQRQDVFRPFYRLEATRSVRTGGSGLGLAIASQLANQNGWIIELMPRDGGGTVARLDIPVIWL